MADESRLEEQALSKAAELQISNQLDSVEELEVNIHTDLGKAVQGKVDSVTLTGKDLTTPQNLHLQEIEVHTGQVSINPLSLLLGKVEMNQPVESIARVVVSEADINQNMNSEYVYQQLAPLKLNVDGHVVLLSLQPPMRLELPGQNKMIFSSTIEVSENGQTRQVGFTGALYYERDRHSVALERFALSEGQTISLEVLAALMTKLKDLIHSPYLEFNGMTFCIQQLEVSEGSITLNLQSQIHQLPSL